MSRWETTLRVSCLERPMFARIAPVLDWTDVQRIDSYPCSAWTEIAAHRRSEGAASISIGLYTPGILAREALATYSHTVGSEDDASDGISINNVVVDSILNLALEG